MVAKVSAKRRVVTSLLSGILFAGWAFWANLDHGLAVAGKSAATQALLTLFMAFIAMALMEVFFKLGKGPLQKYLYSTLGAGSLLLGVNIGVHMIAETPELLNTILPIVIIAVPILAGYAYLLLKDEQIRQIELEEMEQAPDVTERRI